MSLATSNIPSFVEFDPSIIRWQAKFTYDIWNKFDYSIGVHQTLATGSVGSAKSIVCIHNYLKHLTKFSKARGLLGRVVLADLKGSSIRMLLDHMEGDFVEGHDYEYNRSEQKFTFFNGSTSESSSWHKKNFKQWRSKFYSVVFIEELTENDDEYWPAYTAILERMGRLSHVPMNLIMSATNPDGTSHPAYSHFIDATVNDPLRHVYYSLTGDNPFLPSWYIENLKENLTEKEALRQLYGQWVDLDTEKVYYAYSTEKNFRDREYQIDPNLPIDIMHDFNIGFGKPMSCAVGQYRNGNYHIFKEYVVQGARTADIMEEMANDGLFKYRNNFRIFGDASGKDNDTRSIKTDYSIISKFLSNYQRPDQSYINFTMHIPTKNPPIRKRHNLVNGKCENANGSVRFYIYKTAPTAHQGMIKTGFKKGSQYLEDDSAKHPYQHITTAIGYYIYKNEELVKMGSSIVARGRR